MTPLRSTETLLRASLPTLLRERTEALKNLRNVLCALDIEHLRLHYPALAIESWTLITSTPPR